jgi:GNAT superfamily N-acetyltransferase
MQTMAPSTIRPATLADIGALRDLVAAANEPYRGTVPSSFLDGYLASALDVRSRLQEGEVFAAESDDRIVGTITFYLDANDEGAPIAFPARTAGIRVTAVAPSARGLGIGRMLVETCIRRALETESDSIALHTAAFMTSAVALYEKAGFQRVPEHDFPTSRFFRSDPDDDLLAIAYVRPIP